MTATANNEPNPEYEDDTAPSVTDWSATEAVDSDEDEMAEAVEGDEALAPETLTDHDLSSDVSDDQH